jgi:calcineurin-like phosphoesterase family protein
MHKNVFFTSDWHLYHEKSIEFDNRPFRNIEHMHSVLINNYNSSVKDNDICYFLGDMGMCTSEELKLVVSQLNGTKILILGNHDRGPQAMYKVGFEAVMYNATIYLGKNRISMSHCPLRGVWREDTSDMKGAVKGAYWHGDHKNDMFTVADEGQFHLHGHIHSPNGGRSAKTLGKQYDVGVPSSKYRPVSLSTIESWITHYNQVNEVIEENMELLKRL